MAKNKYWDIRPILDIPAQYRIVYGERSNGKTYGTLVYMIEDFVKNGNQFAYVRRWPDDIKKRNMQQLFDSICRNGVISKLTHDEWNGIRYNNGQFFLIATNGEDVVQMEKPFCFTFAISAMEHQKSISYPGVRHILFDEFISRLAYIPDEFALFMNLLSSVIRDRDDVDIWMLGNTVSKECPYFSEMGLKHIQNQKPGTIDTYAYTKDGQELLIAVEYTKNLAAKKSDKYFIFDNPKLEMITSGSWELAVYQRLFEKFVPKQILFTFFVVYRRNILQCEVVEGKNDLFIFVHQKTTPLKDEDNDLIYSPEAVSRYNWRVDISRPRFPVEEKILELIRQERICFQSNEIGEIWNDYLKWCRSHNTIKR